MIARTPHCRILHVATVAYFCTPPPSAAAASFMNSCDVLTSRYLCCEPDWSRPSGEVTLVGVLKAAEKRGRFSPVNKPETGQLLWAEKAALLQAAGCLEGGDGVKPSPILMEAIGESISGGGRCTPRTMRYDLLYNMICHVHMLEKSTCGVWTLFTYRCDIDIYNIFIV